MKIKNILTACLLCFSVAAVLTSCSDDDPFFSASENDEPRILNTDIPEGKGGKPAVLTSIFRNENFKFSVIVTPVEYTTVKWYVDDVQVAEGLDIDVPLLAGNHTLKIVATTTQGKSVSRTCIVEVKALASDPTLATDAKSRWLTTGSTKTIKCTNATSVTKVFIGTQEATNVSFSNGEVTFDVPAMAEGEYQISIEDAEGNRFGCGVVTVSNDEYVEPGVKETVLWEGGTEINWGTSNVLISPETMASVPVGATISLVYELVDMPENYHAMRITTNKWGDEPEDQVVAQFDLKEDTPNPFEFTYTAANKEIVDSREGMLIVGYGYKLTKVIAREQSGPVEQSLWEGATEINWGTSNVLISPEDMAAVAVGAKVRLYYELVDMPENYHAMRITTNKWGDEPEDQVVAQFDLKEDTPNPFEFTYTAANKEIVDAREGMLIVGYGYKLTKVTVE